MPLDWKTAVLLQHARRASLGLAAIALTCAATPAFAPDTDFTPIGACLAGMKACAPSATYSALIELAARPSLTAQDFADLRRLGLAD